MKRLIKIELVFENCEVYEGEPIRDIELHLSQLRPYVLDLPNDPVLRKQAQSILIHVKAHMIDMISRIQQYRDITAIHLTYSDLSELSIVAPWHEACEEENTYQRSTPCPNGDLHVFIARREAHA